MDKTRGGTLRTRKAEDMAEREFRKIEDMTFKECSTELEQIVRQLEAGDLELEDSLVLYGRGVDLLKTLRERLTNAEQKVRVLLDASDAQAGTPDTTSAPSTVYLDE